MAEVILASRHGVWKPLTHDFEGAGQRFKHAQRQRVDSVRILEPCHLAAAGRGPDTEFILLEPAVDSKLYAFVAQRGDRFPDFLDFPSQQR